jgi:hypothetical protein
VATRRSHVEYGGAWVYESIISALPGIRLSHRGAIAIQLVGFQVAIVVVAVVYDRTSALPLGTAVVALAAVGSAEMLRISALVRSTSPPASYRRLLFGSKVEIVLAVLVYVAVVTHLFVFDPRHGDPTALEAVLGTEPPTIAVYLFLLILWDVAYRIGTNWWASVVGLWRALRVRFLPGPDATFTLDSATARTLRRADLETLAFGLVQLGVLPFLGGQPVLRAVLLAHVLAVTAVSGLAAVLMTHAVRNERRAATR